MLRLGYGYDLPSNRTSVTVNGTTSTTSHNAANQVSGWTYDNAGNLTNDGTTSYTYDALNRMTARGTTSYGYNGDGVLMSQTTGGTTTRYAQDLAAPLSQVLRITQGSATLAYTTKMASLVSHLAHRLSKRGDLPDRKVTQIARFQPGF